MINQKIFLEEITNLKRIMVHSEIHCLPSNLLTQLQPSFSDLNNACILAHGLFYTKDLRNLDNQNELKFLRESHRHSFIIVFEYNIIDDTNVYVVHV